MGQAPRTEQAQFPEQARRKPWLLPLGVLRVERA